MTAILTALLNVALCVPTALLAIGAAVAALVLRMRGEPRDE